jgi:hypothetical protein
MITSHPKKIIFIGGASYSGTTILDLILANDKYGFSCGELYKIFLSGREISDLCSCGNSNCNIWKEVAKIGVKNVYDYIFALDSGIKFIVDSSKNPYWIKLQNMNQSKKYQLINLLIYKDPIESFSSFYKRGIGEKWNKHWIDYHYKYMTLLEKFVSISYKDFVTNEESLKRVCQYCKIMYYNSKKEYWKRQHHTVSGNASAKIHLHEKTTSKFKEASDYINMRTKEQLEEINSKYRKIYYDPEDLENSIRPYEKLTKNRKAKKVEQILINKDLKSDERNFKIELPFKDRAKWQFLYRLKKFSIK